MKKYLLVFSLFLIGFLLVGCDKKTTTQAPTTIAPTEATTTVAPTTVAPTTVEPTTAEPTTVLPTFTVTWQVDGVAVEVDNDVVQGTIPTFNGSTPTKPDTVQYSYSFSGWNPIVTAVTGNQVYEAIFSESLRIYTVQFNSNGGSSVASITDSYGGIVHEPQEPEKEGYRFLGWYEDSELTQTVIWPIELQSNLTLYAKWAEVVPFGAYLSVLLNNYSVDTYSFIPETMLPGSRLVSQSQIESIDYSTFMSTSAIPYGGYGEQWLMVLDNLEESQLFFDVLGVVDTVASLSIATFNNFLDSNPEDSSSFDFASGIYNVTIFVQDNTINYILDYTTNLPVFGEQTVQIALSMNYISGDKEGRIQIGDANALRYVVTDNSYQFAIKYAGIRRAYFEISRDIEGNVEGRIFEYLGLDEVFTTGSAAQFFIGEDYASVVGNKSSSMMGWTGTINELYSVDSGELLGYEIRETLSAATYNTLWFNLGDTYGITTIKVLEAPLENSNPYLVYLNGEVDPFVTKTYGGISLKMLSRRYDIELRTQYFYYLDGETLYKVEALIPMLFVQEEMLGSLETDINDLNPTLNFSLQVSTTIQDKIMEDYDTLIDDFILQKEEFTVQAILDFIGEAYTH